MKVIGLIGGMSWESSLEYYRVINEKTKSLLGGHSSSKCLMYSVDFAEIEVLQHKNKWEKLNALMSNAAARLYKGGADIILLCTNTMHLCSDAISSAVPIPFLHIADATGEKIALKGLQKIGLLGTKFTMERDFYKDILKRKYNIETIIPNRSDRQQIHRIIYEELVHGTIRTESRNKFEEIIKRLHDNGAEGVILGCTEIPLLIQQNHVEIPVFDTTTIHAEKAVEWAVNQ